MTSAETADWIADALRASQGDKERFHRTALGQLQQRYLAVQGKLDRAYDDWLAGQITDEMWSRKSAEWETELQTIRRETAKHEQASHDYAVTGSKILELAKSAPRSVHSAEFAGSSEVAENTGFELHVRSRESFSYIQKAVRHARGRQRKRELAGRQGCEPEAFGSVELGGHARRLVLSSRPVLTDASKTLRRLPGPWASTLDPGSRRWPGARPFHNSQRQDSEEGFDTLSTLQPVPRHACAGRSLRMANDARGVLEGAPDDDRR